MSRRPRRGAVPATLLALGAAALAGCAGRGGGPSATPDANGRRPVPVVASAWPLAQLTAYIGGPDVAVTDLAARGLAPQGLAVGTTAEAEIARARLVVDVGDGYQREVEAAAARRPHLAVLPAVSRQARPYQFWLDPTLMAKAATAISAALERADPAARSRFANGARDFESVASSVGSDYVNSLSTCTRSTFMTTDDGFGRLAARFRLHEASVMALGTGAAERLVRRDQLPAVYTEDGVSAGPLQVVAGLTGRPVKTLDPMEMAPLSGTAKENSYFAVMENNLHALEGGLGCDSSELFS
jgi:zinc transport system substrate-binding protein